MIQIHNFSKLAKASSCTRFSAITKTTDRGNPLEYYLKSLLQSFQRNEKKNHNQIRIWILVFNATFSNIMGTSFSGGGSRSTRRESPTLGKQLVNFITCGCLLDEINKLCISSTKKTPTQIGWKILKSLKSPLHFCPL